MGKITGFMEYKRGSVIKAPVDERLRNYNEFEKPFPESDAKIQAARCMDCGIPFCHGDTGCPVDNLIPEFNDLVYHGKWEEAFENLSKTNNFPEFTGRLCPAPCESACTLGLIDKPVMIKTMEKTIIENAFIAGVVKPQKPKKKTAKKIAIIGSGPAGMANAQQLARAGHTVVVYEKNDRIGGLLRYGIPDFKMEKSVIDRRIEQMTAEGVEFKTGVNVGIDLTAKQLLSEYDAVVLAMGSEDPRDLPVPGRELTGVYFAMEYLVQQNKVNAGDKIDPSNRIDARGKDVVVIGGGDTGSDCVGTANRQGAKSVTQIEIFPEPPKERPASTPWPLYPRILQISTSHEEGVIRKWSINTDGFKGHGGKLTSIYGHEVKMEPSGKFAKIAGTDFAWPADLVFLAMGFIHPRKEGLLAQLGEMGLKFGTFGTVDAKFGTDPDSFQTSMPKVFACGDVRRGQSLIVWAISEGRKCARRVHNFLMAET